METRTRSSVKHGGL